LLVDLAGNAIFFLSVGTSQSLTPLGLWLPAGWEKAERPGHVAQPRAGSTGRWYTGRRLAMKSEKGKHKTLPPWLFLWDTVVTLTRCSK